MTNNDKRESEEDARARGLRLTYRLDELERTEHRHVTQKHRVRYEDAVIDIYKPVAYDSAGRPAGLSKGSAIVHVTDTSGKLLDDDRMLTIYLSERWLIPNGTRAAWGHIDRKRGFVNYIFQDTTKRHLGKPDPFSLKDSLAIHPEAEIFRTHIYKKVRHLFQGE